MGRALYKALSPQRSELLACASILIALASLFFILEMAYTEGWRAILNSHSLMRMDSGLYMSIVERGYEFFSCEKIPGMNPKDHCGNCGWFPGYPALVTALNWAGVPQGHAAIGISFLATCGLLFMTMVLSRGEKPVSWAAPVAIALLAAFFPGQIYFFAVFPLSLAVFLILVSMYFFTKERIYTAAVFAALGAFCYPGAAWYVGALTAVTYYTNAGFSINIKAIRRPFSVFLIGFTGFAAVLLVHYLSVGLWDAFFLTQAKYGHTIHWPFESIAKHFEYPHQKTPVWYHIQLMNFTRSMLLVAAAFVCWKKRNSIKPIDTLALCQGTLAWLMPLIAANPHTLASLRSGTLMLPIVVIFGHLSIRYQLPLAAYFAYQATNTAKFFSAGNLP